ncbi:MAG: UDP-N-acetylmuramate dehydrogenase [Clostridia bacterium]|nr:UDP-N-acetylmuramate dehydrogenase [Clostridia bacterium]
MALSREEIRAALSADPALADRIRIEENAPLSALTGFRTGGAATVARPGSEAALIALVRALRERGEPFFLLGNGTNVLAMDDGYAGVVILLTDLKEVRVEGEEIFASCGAGLTATASLAEKHALTGLEFAYGIPGTVGGGVFMNAGAYDGELSRVVTEVRALMPDGSIRAFTGEEAGFGYRVSAFQENGGVILSARFALRSGDRAAIREKMDDLMARRREKQPLEYPSCGSTFKRFPGRYTAQMIDQAGLKGARIGGAMVSEKHAGFIINYDRASSSDILELIELVKKTIREREGVEIQCEIRFLR